MIIKWLVSTAFGIDTNPPDKNKTPTPPTSVSSSTSTPPSASTNHSTTSQSTTTPPPQHVLSHADLDDRPPYPPVFSARSLRQLGLMLSGAGFFYWSVMISRRAAVRHHLASQLRFFTGHHEYLILRGVGLKDLPGYLEMQAKHYPSLPSLAQRREPMLAAEALSLASLNLMSFAIMAAGGLSWAFDISSLEDLQRYSRRSVAKSVGRRLQKEVEKEEDAEIEKAEQEVAEWFGRTFGLIGVPPATEEGQEKERKEEEGKEGTGKKKGWWGF
ncbi:hypothetical protein VTJ04DRAFT_2507 [Mycothermus thermophilus]|uniref:uncharacterized protein n=1 Tax=Humicola insolens TaxID=85995 RepID=UPI0037432227